MMPARMVFFFTATKQHTVRQDRGHHAAVAGDGEHVLQKHQVGFLGAQRHLSIRKALGLELGPPGGSAIGILLGAAPVYGERRVGEHPVKVHELAALHVLRLGQGVVVLQVGVADAVQQHVHLGDGPHGAVELLTKESGLAAVFAMLVDVFLGGNQHAAGATAGVVDFVLELGFDQPHHHAHHGAWRIKLAAFLARRVGKLADQVLVGGAQQVGKFEVFIVQAVDVEVRDELLQLDVGDLALANLSGEVDVLQHVVEADVFTFDACQRFAEQVADIGLAGVVHQVGVARLLWHPEISILFVPTFDFGGKLGVGLAFASVQFDLDDFFAALLEHVGAALEKEHAEDVFLELGGVHLAAKDVGGFEEVALKLRQG